MSYDITFIIGDLPTGGMATIKLYDSTGSEVALTDDACSEIGVTGFYRWLTSNITTYPANPTTYFWVMTDGSRRDKGPVVIGPRHTKEEIRQEMDANSIQLGEIRTNSDRVDGLIEDVGGDQFTAKALSQVSVESAAVNFPNDETYNGAVGYEIITGTWISGTAADTTAVGTPLVFAPSGVDVLDVNFEFQIASARPSEVIFRGYYNGAGGAPNTRYAHVYVWDYAAVAWVLLTDAGNRVAQGTVNGAYSWMLQPQHQDPATGTVKLRYVSSRVTAADRLYIDFHVVQGQVSGATVGEIAEAVWTRNIRNRQLDGTHLSAGYFVARTAPEWGAVTNVTGDEVTMSGDYFNDEVDLYNGRMLQFHQNGEQVYETRRIVRQNTGGILVLDKAPILVASSGWHGYILPEITTEPAPTAVENRQEMDANSIQLGQIRINSDRVDGLIEDDGFGNDRFTAKAVEEAGASTGDIQTGCEAALETFNLDHLLAVAATGADVTDNSVIAKMTSKSATADFDSFNNVTDSLEAIADSSSTPPTAEDIRIEMDSNSTKLSGIKGDTEDIKEALENQSEEPEEWNP